MKLRHLHIEDYKMFKDFDISFVDENDEPLPIVVLAGVNGSGKTTLLEFVFNFISKINEKNQSLIEIEKIKNQKVVFDYDGFLDFDKQMHIAKGGGIPVISQNYPHLKNNFLYFSTNTNIENIKDFLPKKIENMVYQEEIPPREAYNQVRKYINNILKNLNPQIEFDSRDGEGNLFFRNKNGGDKFFIDELSTGEKTLMSKVLYLYLEDIRDKVILIDEPELSLHPSWQNKVLKIYENFAIKNNCQIIIATHSPHIIGSAKAEYVRVLKKVDNKIEVYKYTQSYGLEFNKILVDIMEADTRVSDVSERLSKIKSLIIQNDFDSDEFKEIWSDLERLIGADNIDLRLLKLEIASRRKKNVSNR